LSAAPIFFWLSFVTVIALKGSFPKWLTTCRVGR